MLRGSWSNWKNKLVGWIAGGQRTDGTQDTRVFRDEGEKHSPDLDDRYLTLASFKSRGRRLAITNSDSVGAFFNDQNHLSGETLKGS